MESLKLKTQMNMKYRLLFIALLAGFSFSCEREMSPEQAERFIKFYGNQLMDEARDLEALDDGGFAICGVDSLPNVGKRMVLIVTDAYGNLRGGFPRYYTEEGLESVANTIVPIRGGQGGFLLAGYVERPIDGTMNVQKDIFLVKTSTSGNISWMKSYGSSEDEVVLHAAERISSGFMLAGYKVKNGKSDILIMGVEQEGDSIKLGLNYNNPYAEHTQANFLLNTGEQYLCVCTYDKIGNAGTTDILVLSFDDELNPHPENLTDDSNEMGTCIIQDGPENYLVLGNRVISNRSEIVIHQIETAGLVITKSVLLATISESNMDLIGKRFVKTRDNGYAIVGTRQSDGEQELFLQLMTSDYNPSGRIIFGASGDQYGADIDLPDDGGIVLLGTNRYEENSMISLIRTNDTGDL
jgi:hypothetical protein